MTAAAFKATYSDFKLIKTRSVVSISFELPVEQAQGALDVLGGMPVAATEVWCGIARLNPGAEAKPTLAPSTKSDASSDSAALGPNSGFDSRDQGHQTDQDCRKEVVPTESKSNPTDALPRQKETTGGAKQKFRDMRLPNQAGILCTEAPFQKFLLERHIKYARGTEPTMDDKLAADCVRLICGVKSRSDIRPRTPSGDRWNKLVMDYRTWLHAPEMVA